MKVLLKQYSVQIVEVLKQYNNINNIENTRGNMGVFCIIPKKDDKLAKKSI